MKMQLCRITNFQKAEKREIYIVMCNKNSDKFSFIYRFYFN